VKLTICGDNLLGRRRSGLNEEKKMVSPRVGHLEE